MALSSVILQQLHQGSEKLVTIKVTGDASYPTGGYAVTPALFGLVAFAPSADANGPNVPVAGSYAITADLQGNPYSGVNPANGNLQLFVATTGAEVANTTNETGTSVLLEAYGH